MIGGGVVLEGSQMIMLDISGRKDARLAGLSRWSRRDLVSSVALVQMSIFDPRSSTVIISHYSYGAFGRSIGHISGPRKTGEPRRNYSNLLAAANCSSS